MRRPIALLSALLIGLLGIAGLTAPAQAALGPAIYLVPHQDDDVLSYGADMKAHVQAGREVIAVLLTDGSESGVCYQRFGDPNLTTAQERDAGGLDQAARDQCTAIRDAEFTGAMEQMGITPVIREDRKQDSCSSPDIAATSDSCTDANTLTERYVKNVIQEYLAQYPNASMKGYSYKEDWYCTACGNGTTGPGHPDHDLIGEALRDTANLSWGTPDVRFMVKPSLWTYWPGENNANDIGFWTHYQMNVPLDFYGDNSPLAPGNGIGHDSSSLFCEQYGGPRAEQEQISNTRNCSNYDYFNHDGADSYIHKVGR